MKSKTKLVSKQKAVCHTQSAHLHVHIQSSSRDHNCLLVPERSYGPEKHLCHVFVIAQRRIKMAHI